MITFVKLGKGLIVAPLRDGHQQGNVVACFHDCLAIRRLHDPFANKHCNPADLRQQCLFRNGL